jgi:hypothetical protein
MGWSQSLAIHLHPQHEQQNRESIDDFVLIFESVAITTDSWNLPRFNPTSPSCQSGDITRLPLNMERPRDRLHPAVCSLQFTGPDSDYCQGWIWLWGPSAADSISSISVETISWAIGDKTLISCPRTRRMGNPPQ